MERFHLEIELDDDDARRVQAVLMANDMTMKQFAEYAIVKVAEAHVGDNSTKAVSIYLRASFFIFLYTFLSQ